MAAKVANAGRSGPLQVRLLLTQHYFARAATTFRWCSAFTEPAIRSVKIRAIPKLLLAAWRINSKVSELRCRSFFHFADAAFARNRGTYVVATQRASSIRSFMGVILNRTDSVLSLHVVWTRKTQTSLPVDHSPSLSLGAFLILIHGIEVRAYCSFMSVTSRVSSSWPC